MVAGPAHGLGHPRSRLPGEVAPLRGRAPLPPLEPGGCRPRPAVLPGGAFRRRAARLGDGRARSLSARPFPCGPGGCLRDGRPLHRGRDPGRGAPAPPQPRERGNRLHDRSPRRGHPVGCGGGRVPGPIPRGPRDASGCARVGGSGGGPPAEPLGQALGAHTPLRAGRSRPGRTRAFGGACSPWRSRRERSVRL